MAVVIGFVLIEFRQLSIIVCRRIVMELRLKYSRIIPLVIKSLKLKWYHDCYKKVMYAIVVIHEWFFVIPLHEHSLQIMDEA